MFKFTPSSNMFDYKCMAIFLLLVVVLVLRSSAAPTTTSTTNCASDQKQCNNGTCIPTGYRCPEDDCTAGLFSCLNNVTCIDSSKTCDGTDDCGDGSDESTLPPTNCTPPASNKWWASIPVTISILVVVAVVMFSSMHAMKRRKKCNTACSKGAQVKGVDSEPVTGEVSPLPNKSNGI